ncbi:MAG: hypothetical protein MJE77_44640 [Proteobacteria bacterium]|nr:hypothetical protein [Pseudomonadota bacterium]
MIPSEIRFTFLAGTPGRGPGRLVLLLIVVILTSSCATSTVPDAGIEGLELISVNPDTVVPNSTLVIEGRSFVGEPFATSKLRLRGVYRPDVLSEFDVDVALTAEFIDFNQLNASAGSVFFAALENLTGVFDGEAVVEVLSAVNGRTYTTAPLPVEIKVSSELPPRLDRVETHGDLIFVNDRIEVSGDGLLLGGGEGTTFAVVSGTYLPEGATEERVIGPVEVPITPASRFDRSRGHFEFSPTIVGILPGHFDGEVFLRNRHAGRATPESSAAPVSYNMIRPTIFAVSTREASLGQYVSVEGGGFVGRVAEASTTIRLQGTYTPRGAAQGELVDIELIPEFASGGLVRYVMSEDDVLGKAVNLRRESGDFYGQVTPIISYQDDTVIGDPVFMALAVGLIKQVVYLNFQISYVESLRRFGLRAMDSRIREMVAEHVRHAFVGLNVEVRREEPDDFALYSVVDIAGPDPNGLGLLGYDNAPGKDVDNERLADRIGGVNATQLENGLPGYGGVFIESMLGFSADPGGVAEKLPVADPLFDAIFDPFRPDRGGSPVVAADLDDGVIRLADPGICPASERSEQIACAVWALGSLIANTVSHEIGHSLGLANPSGEGVHNPGDQVGRLMDAGSKRPFAERAQLDGQGPARFCVEEYEYLREILPTEQKPVPLLRPSCQ